MAFAGSRHIDASQGIFTDISGTQNTINIHYNSSGPSKSDARKAVPYQPLPYHNELFTGRDVDLRALEHYFGPRDTCHPGRRFLVYGMGGAGKTQMCSRFAEQVLDRFWRVFWVDATTAETLELSFLAIAMDPGAQVVGDNRSPQSALQWLSVVKHDWLLVLDNVDDEDIVAKYIPGNRGNILFTSRNPNLARLVSPGNRIEVKDMEEEDAISLLLKSSGNNEWTISDREAARPIVKELFCLPLAVDQAGAAIASGLCRMDDYLLMYNQRRQELLADPMFKGASGYGRAVYGTWDLSFTAIRQMGSQEAESAIFILRTFAFFHHENISEEMFKRAAEDTEELDKSLAPHLFQVDQNGIWDPFLFRKGIRILLSYSLVKRSKMGDVFSLHPLVHCWSRDSMSDEERRTSSSAALTVLSSSIAWSFTSADLTYRRTLVPHIYAVKSGSELSYDEDVYTGFFLVFSEAGHWKEAGKLEVQILEMQKRVLGEEHPHTLASMNNMVLVYKEQGRLKDAEELGVQTLEPFKRVFGDEHPYTLTIMNNLAMTYKNQGRLKDAVELEVQVMEMRKRVLGDEHPDTLKSMNNLAMTYERQGRWKEAVELEVQAMEASKRVLGEEHPDTLTNINNLALMYDKQGRLKDAMELGVQVVEMRKKVIGDEHPDTLISMNDLALMYFSRGQREEAEKLEVQVMEMQKRVLGEEHPHTLAIMGNLAMMYKEQGRLEDAEELGIQVIDMQKRVLGEEHPDTLTNMGNLATTYLRQERLKNAEELGVQVMDMRKRVLGEEHPDTLTTMSSLAMTYLRQERWKNAEELGVLVMGMQKRVLGEDHPHTLISMNNLAVTYQSQGRWKDAEELGIQVLELQKRVLGDERPDTLRIMGNLAVTYENQGRWKDAVELGVQVIQTSKRVFGEEHPATLKAVQNLVWYQNQGRNKSEVNTQALEQPPERLRDDNMEAQNSVRVHSGIAALSRVFKRLHSRRRGRAS